MDNKISKHSEEGGFFKAPSVILIVGSTIRRLHMLHSISSYLKKLGNPFFAFTNTFDEQEINIFHEKGNDPIYFKKFDFNAFKNAYKELEQPFRKKSFIIIEIDTKDLINTKFRDFQIQTVIFTDIYFESKEDTEVLIEHLNEQAKRFLLFQTIIYNNDIVDTGKKQKLYYLDVEEVPIKNHLSFGKTDISNIKFIQKDNSLHIVSEEEVMDIDYPIDVSDVKKDGVFGAIATLMIEKISDLNEVAKDYPSLPYVEDDFNFGKYFWAKYVKHDEEIFSILKVSHFICLDMTSYLKYENVIETNVTEFDKIVVISDNKDQEELLGDYFLQKEKDSYYTVLYNPEHGSLMDNYKNVFGDNKYLYIFEELEMFEKIVKYINRV